jgi:hypothetical protein
MSKAYSAKDASLAVLAKVEEMLKKSEMMKAAPTMGQTLGGAINFPGAAGTAPVAKYEATNSKKVGYKPSELGGEEKKAAVTDADDNRCRQQKSPEKNPKEKAEGNNLDSGRVQGGRDFAKDGSAIAKAEAQDRKAEGLQPVPAPEAPQEKGHLKLAKFLNVIRAKRLQKQGKM